MRCGSGLALENKSLVKYKLIIDAGGGWDYSSRCSM